MSQCIPELSNFLKKTKLFTSPAIQNALTRTGAHFVLRGIVSDIITSGYYSIIWKKNISWTVRNSFLNRRDNFRTCEGRTLPGQCYHGESKMPGINKRVQKIMPNLQSLATYVHCSNHSLNLDLQCSVRAVALIRDCMQWVNDVGVYVRQRHVRTSALDVLLEAYPHILELLGEIVYSNDSGNEAASKAGGLSDQLSKEEIYLGMIIFCRVFGPSQRLSVTLRNPHVTCSSDAESLEATKAHFLKCRTD
ncbi:hypothetical protein PR048_024785 [Dryococelus australis]|uniref:Uncharacterized protein n=1 Tax=Dryococelus australis TaxID=614101 RepID=A0ABQ9GPH7_9NEOP|nr:hypothetical protein PR048_024785 [Dryococelus australis]